MMDLIVEKGEPSGHQKVKLLKDEVIYLNLVALPALIALHITY